ncbi:MAG: hypothetical protein H7327_04365 [Herminiimonas sp.]|nr:hypothetical protein [Herminiimonas sp.]
MTRAGYEATLDVGLPAPVAVPAGLPSWWAVAVAATLSLPLLLPMLARFTLSGWLQLLLARVLSR